MPRPPPAADGPAVTVVPAGGVGSASSPRSSASGSAQCRCTPGSLRAGSANGSGPVTAARAASGSPAARPSAPEPGDSGPTRATPSVPAGPVAGTTSAWTSIGTHTLGSRRRSPLHESTTDAASPTRVATLNSWVVATLAKDSGS
jgi:hypothetical protein